MVDVWPGWMDDGDAVMETVGAGFSGSTGILGSSTGDDTATVVLVETVPNLTV
jgi:hypothetical protein